MTTGDGRHHHHDRNPATIESSILKRVVVCAFGLVATTVAALGLYGTHGTHFQHHTARLLADIAAAPGIAVTVVARPGANLPEGTRVHGFLFPRRVPRSSAAIRRRSNNNTSGNSSDNAVNGDADVVFDGRLSYEFLGVQYNFTLLNGRGYVTTTNVSTTQLLRNDCLQPDNVPPVHLFTDALRQARVVDAVGGAFTVPCGDGDGKLVEFTFAGEPYVLCSRPTTAARTEIHGEDLEATIELLREHSEGLPTRAMLTRPQGKRIGECAVLNVDGDISEFVSGEAEDGVAPTPAPSPSPSRSRRRLVAKAQTTMTTLATRTRDAWTVLSGQRRLAATDDCATTCPTGKRACLFVHGLGKQESGPVADSYESYWGNVHARLPCCSTVKFMRMDTINTPWYEPRLADEVCAAARALASPETKGPMALEGLAIIAHSMGNLITANAAMTNKCALGKTSKWIALGGPLLGSRSANYGIGICRNDPSTSWDDPVVQALGAIGVCPGRASLRSIVFEHSPESTPEQDALLRRAQETYARRVSAGLCGTSPTGLMSTKSIKFGLLGKLSGHASAENDGAVDFGSCRGTLAAARYQPSWRGGNFYKAAINHGDASMDGGDGWWGDDRKPLKWLQCQL